MGYRPVDPARWKINEMLLKASTTHKISTIERNVTPSRWLSYPLPYRGQVASVCLSKLHLVVFFFPPDLALQNLAELIFSLL